MAFLIRLILLELIIGFCVADLMDSGTWNSDRFTTLAVLVVLSIYGVVFVFLPRVRDCSMPGWTLVFAVIPVASTLYGFILMFGASRVLRFGGQEPDAPATSPTIPGSKCLSCGKLLVLATDGVINPYGGVLCSDCYEASGAQSA
jgi:hypothetical protein